MFLNNIQNIETDVIKGVQFGVYSEQEILSTAVCEVKSLQIYDFSGLPAREGLSDPRMGVTLRGLQCQTCQGDMKSCPGHFGRVALEEMIYHPQFIEMTYKILKSVCYNCSKLLISPDRLPYILSIKNKEKRLGEISQSASFRCGFDEDPGCSCKQPKYRQRKMDITIKTTDDNEGDNDEDSNRVLPASDAYRILSEIKDETIEILGMDKNFSRPKDLILSQLIVSPPSARPSIQMSSTARAEDDLTHLYQSILSTNLELKKEKNAGQTKVRINELVLRL